MQLGEPVPLPGNYDQREWFHNVTKSEAVDILKRIPKLGAFLVRPSSLMKPIHNAYSFSFRWSQS